MAMVRVFGNTFLNPDCVGKVYFKPTFTDDSRTNTTIVYDMTGQHELLKAQTTVTTPAPLHDPNAVKRDNHIHAEIVKALHERRDAVAFQEGDELAASGDDAK